LKRFIIMALNKFKVDLDKQDDGSWMSFGGMRFKVKATTDAINNKINKALANEKNSTAEKIQEYNRIVWNDLVTGWEKVSTVKLQSYIVSEEFHNDEHWHEIDDMQFLLKRVNSSIAKDIERGTTHAKTRKFITKCLKDWRNVRLDENSDVIEYSPSEALNIFSDPEYSDAVKEFVNNAINHEKYLANIKDADIKYSEANVKKYMVEVDVNDITQYIRAFANDNENYRADLIESDIETAKK